MCCQFWLNKNLLMTTCYYIFIIITVVDKWHIRKGCAPLPQITPVFRQEWFNFCLINKTTNLSLWVYSQERCSFMQEMIHTYSDGTVLVFCQPLLLLQVDIPQSWLTWRRMLSLIAPFDTGLCTMEHQIVTCYYVMPCCFHLHNNTTICEWWFSICRLNSNGSCRSLWCRFFPSRFHRPDNTSHIKYRWIKPYSIYL